MGRRLLVIVALGGSLAAAAFVYYRASRVEAAPTILTSPVTRGDVIERVDATGTLQAVTTVQVGTQVSGTIKSLHADFNARVRRGDVIARLEPSLFETQVEQARATLVRLQADAERAVVQLDDAQRKLRRARELATSEIITATDLEAADLGVRQAEAAVRSADAQIVQARASLHQAEVNLGHTIISAPIDGIVISRRVDVGQTVAASMQTPTLFIIARDLAEMQVNASIAESDIGRVQPGQRVTFRVDAYPDEVFAGVVSQVRLEPVVEQNVVSYVTVIGVPNPSLRLKPGMTANVTLEIARAENVLRVPNAALRVRPSAAVLAALGHPAPEPAEWADRSRQGGQERGTSGVESELGKPGQVWLVLENGQLERVPVEVGISDGVTTAVLGGPLAEGAAIVAGIEESAAVEDTERSPLLPFGGRPPGAGRGGAGGTPQRGVRP
jgi:HlyD family secretion protein